MCGSLCLEGEHRVRVPSLPSGRDFPATWPSGGREDVSQVRGSGSGGSGFRSHLCTCLCASSGKSFPLAAPYFLLDERGKVGSLGELSRIPCAA